MSGCGIAVSTPQKNSLLDPHNNNPYRCRGVRNTGNLHINSLKRGVKGVEYIVNKIVFEPLTWPHDFWWSWLTPASIIKVGTLSILDRWIDGPSRVLESFHPSHYFGINKGWFRSFLSCYFDNPWVSLLKSDSLCHLKNLCNTTKNSSWFAEILSGLKGRKKEILVSIYNIL